MAQRICLAQDVWLTAVQSDKFKTGCFSVNFLRPLRREEAACNALIPGILLGGTKEHPDIRSISIRLDELYGASVGSALRKKGETQIVGLYADYIEDAIVSEPVFAPLCAFVSELLFSPLTEDGGFSPAVFDMERSNLINAMRARINDKQSYANQQLLRIMFSQEPYGIPYHGDEEDLCGVTPKTLYAQYRRLLASSRVELFYLGRETPEAAAAVFRDMLKELPRQSCDALPKAAGHVPSAVRYVEEQLPLEQSKLSIGCRAATAKDARDLAAMLVFSVIYGAGSGSKLFTKVREEQSLCYYANAIYDKYQGFLRINSGISQENFETAKGEILRQLQACRDGRFTLEELEIAKTLLISQLRSDMDSPSRLDEFYLGQAVLNENMTVTDLLKAVGTVSAEAVRQAANTVREDTVFFLRGVGA